MADDFIPSNDAEFDQLPKQLITAVATDPAKYGLLPQDVTALQADQATWDKARAGHIKAQEDARTATKTKDTARRRTPPATRSSLSTHARRTPMSMTPQTLVRTRTICSAGRTPRASPARGAMS